MENKFTVIEHLEELRRRIIVCLVFIGISSIVVYLNTERLMGLLVKPVGKLVFISPVEVFIAYLKLSVWGGVFLSLPVILYQVWKFISIGLKAQEKNFVLLYTLISFFLVIISWIFAYGLVIPVSLKFLLGFGGPNIFPMISVGKYISFVGMFLLVFAVVFQTPLIILFLTKFRLVTPQFLARKRKHFILVIFIVSGLLTPPDVFTQLMVSLPMIILYELSIWLSKMIKK